MNCNPVVEEIHSALVDLPDFIKTGRTLSSLNLGHHDRAGLQQFLHEGFP